MWEDLLQMTDPAERDAQLRKIGNYKFEHFEIIPLFDVYIEVVVDPKIVDDWAFSGWDGGDIGHTFRSTRVSRRSRVSNPRARDPGRCELGLGVPSRQLHAPACQQRSTATRVFVPNGSSSTTSSRACARDTEEVMYAKVSAESISGGGTVRY